MRRGRTGRCPGGSDRQVQTDRVKTDARDAEHIARLLLADDKFEDESRQREVVAEARIDLRVVGAA